MFVARPLAALAGARPEILKKAPHTRHRFVTLGGVLLSTAGMATASAAFAVHMALGYSWNVAFVVGGLWGLLILNLDRMLVVGLAADPSKTRSLLMALPRIGLALILGTVIATPMTLQVFHREIDAEVIALQAEQSHVYKVALDKDERYATLPALLERIHAEQDVVASQGASDPGLAQLHANVEAAQQAFDEQLALYQEMTGDAQCELNGTCGTGVVGTGTAFYVAKDSADAQLAQVQQAKEALARAQSFEQAAGVRAAQTAADNLARDTADYKQRSAEKEKLQRAFDDTNAHNDGILIRLQAMTRLGTTNPTMGVAQWLLELLFISIELLPVLMKTLMIFSPASTYDHMEVRRDKALNTTDELDCDLVVAKARTTFNAEIADLGGWRELARGERERVHTKHEIDELEAIWAASDTSWLGLIRRATKKRVEEMA